MKSQIIKLTLLMGTGLFALTAAPALAHNSDDNNKGNSNGPVVQTTEGPVRGLTKDRVNEFLGIPYAQPPVGELRWRPPAPPKKHGPLDATEFSEACPQVTSLGPFSGPSSTSEDCLYLNVYTTSTKGPLKPVIVWMHGGGNIDGSTRDYDGAKLATGGPYGVPTVVVTMNYRLGLLGVLSESHLNSEGHLWGNYHFLDQQAALRWVKANIARFGGDPNRVALGGQSAGAIDLAGHQRSALAAGLFNRAIYMSLPISGRTTAADVALTRGNNFAAAAGCSSSACLRRLSVERILQLQGTPNASGPFVTGNMIFDGTIVSILADDAWTSGRYNKMPIMGGSTEDDGGGTFDLGVKEYFSGPPQLALTPEEYAARNTPAVLAQYPLSKYNNDPSMAQNRAGGDLFKCDGRRVLNQLATTNTGYGVYGYDFDYEKAPYYFPRMPNVYNTVGPAAGFFLPLAPHTVDIQFVFPGWHGGKLGVNIDQITGQPRELQGAEIKLSDQIVGAWTRFAATGNPNGWNVPNWPVFKSGSGPFLAQGIPNALMTDAEFNTKYNCSFWAGPH